MRRENSRSRSAFLWVLLPRSKHLQFSCAIAGTVVIHLDAIGASPSKRLVPTWFGEQCGGIHFFKPRLHLWVVLVFDLFVIRQVLGCGDNFRGLLCNHESIIFQGEFTLAPSNVFNDNVLGDIRRSFRIVPASLFSFTW